MTARKKQTLLLLLGPGLLMATHAFAQNDSAECGEKREPAQVAEEYCQRHGSTPLLAEDSEVRAAQAACKSFYAKAAEGVNLLCEYRAQSAGFRERYAKLRAALPAGQNSETREMRALQTEASQAALEAAARADELEFALGKAYKNSAARLEAVARLGVARMGREMACGSKGDGGRAPGVFLAGLQSWQSKDEKQTYENVAQALVDLRAMGLAAANDKRALLGRPDRIKVDPFSSLGELGVSPDCAVEPELKKLSPGNIPAVAAVSGVTGVIASYPQFATVKPVLTGAWGASIAYGLLVKHTVDVHSLVIVGLASFASATLGPEAYAPASVGLNVLDAALQNRIKEQKSRYLKFVRYRLNEDLTLSSEAVGEEWKISPESGHSCG